MFRVAERPQDRDDKATRPSLSEEERRADPAYRQPRKDPRRAEG
jgi:hypothetical protein